LLEKYMEVHLLEGEPACMYFTHNVYQDWDGRLDITLFLTWEGSLHACILLCINTGTSALSFYNVLLQQPPNTYSCLVLVLAANAPGYYTHLTNGVQKCPNGTYAAGWARRNVCTTCGTNILSAENSIDETDGASRVSASPNDCCKCPSVPVYYSPVHVYPARLMHAEDVTPVHAYRYIAACHS
jgi:hypothetical protein